MSYTGALAIGQIWRENDERYERFVRVLQIDDLGYGQRSVMVCNVQQANGKWVDLRGGQLSWINAKRFDGAEGNFMLHEDGKA